MQKPERQIAPGFNPKPQSRLPPTNGKSAGLPADTLRPSLAIPLAFLLAFIDYRLGRGLVLHRMRGVARHPVGSPKRQTVMAITTRVIRKHY